MPHGSSFGCHDAKVFIEHHNTSENSVVDDMHSRSTYLDAHLCSKSHQVLGSRHSTEKASECKR